MIQSEHDQKPNRREKKSTHTTREIMLQCGFCDSIPKMMECEGGQNVLQKPEHKCKLTNVGFFLHRKSAILLQKENTERISFPSDLLKNIAENIDETSVVAVKGRR